MKAAIMDQKGGVPQYTDFPEPVAKNGNELLITMKAAALKHLDKSRAKGEHYSAENKMSQPTILGGDGVGLLEDGTRVYAIGIGGMMAEKAVVEKHWIAPLPARIDDVVAAALPNAVMGSAMGLRFRAGMKGGETVLINGATSFTGKIAVQIAKHYGASRIIVTGRNEQTLLSLLALGADEIITLNGNDEAFISRIKSLHQQTPIDIIIDYLWGHTAERMLSALKGSGSFTHKIKFISIGAITGDTIQLSAQLLRSVDLQLSGSGLGSWTKEEVQQLFSEILPDMFGLAASNQLKVDTAVIPLQDIATAWDMNIPNGKRLVVRI